MSSYDELRLKLGSLVLREGLEMFRRFGFDEKPPGSRDAGIGPG